MSNQAVTENWSISLKIVIPIITGMIGLTVWLTSQLWRIETRQSLAWTLHDQREWANEVHAMNPGVSVPNPNDIFWSNRVRFSELAAPSAFATKQ